MDNATAALIGSLVGAIVGIFILYTLWEFALFKRVLDDPLKGKIGSVVAAYLSASIIRGFAGADGGAFDISGFGTYLFGAVVIGFLAVRRGLELRRNLGSDVSEAFE